ncbi:hypothetical protein ACHAXS_002322 [Conticribra weissflogii]
MMSLLMDDDRSISNPRNDIIEGQARSAARTRVHESMVSERGRGYGIQAGDGDRQIDTESQVSRNMDLQGPEFDFDEQVLAAAFRGWIDELDIYKRKGCRFLKRKRRGV